MKIKIRREYMGGIPKTVRYLTGGRLMGASIRNMEKFYITFEYHADFMAVNC